MSVHLMPYIILPYAHRLWLCGQRPRVFGREAMKSMRRRVGREAVWTWDALNRHHRAKARGDHASRNTYPDADASLPQAVPTSWQISIALRSLVESQACSNLVECFGVSTVRRRELVARRLSRHGTKALARRQFWYEDNTFKGRKLLIMND